MHSSSGTIDQTNKCLIFYVFQIRTCEREGGISHPGQGALMSAWGFLLEYYLSALQSEETESKI